MGRVLLMMCILTIANLFPILVPLPRIVCILIMLLMGLMRLSSWTKSWETEHDEKNITLLWLMKRLIIPLKILIMWLILGRWLMVPLINLRVYDKVKKKGKIYSKISTLCGIMLWRIPHAHLLWWMWWAWSAWCSGLNIHRTHLTNHWCDWRVWVLNRRTRCTQGSRWSLLFSSFKFFVR